MERITLRFTKKINDNLKEITKRTFEIPSRILCPEDNEIMNFDSYHKIYFCDKCNTTISGKEYVLSQLEKTKDNEEISTEY